MKILFLESKWHYKRANIINIENEFPNSKVYYNGGYFQFMPPEFFEKYDLIVSTLYQSISSSIIVLKCRKVRVKTLLLSDGIIEWENLYNNRYMKRLGISLYDPIFHDFFAVMGNKEKQYFNGGGTTHCVNFVPDRVKINLEHEKESVSMFLITTANNPYMDINEKEQLFEIILSTQRYLMNKKIDYKCRIFDADLLSALLEQDSSLYNDIDSKFDECIANVTCLITTPSSIILTAMARNIPTAQLIYRNSPIFLQSGWMITSAKNISNTISQMQNFNDERMSFQKSIVIDYFKEDDNLKLKTSVTNIQKYDDYFDNLINRSRYVIDFEPCLRHIDDFLKNILPKQLLAKWKSFVKKVKYKGLK